MRFNEVGEEIEATRAVAAEANVGFIKCNDKLTGRRWIIVNYILFKSIILWKYYFLYVSNIHLEGQST